MNANETLDGEMKMPYCNIDLPFSMHAYDHLKGVALRSTLSNSSEKGLISILSNIIPNIQSVDEFGHHVAVGLEKVNLFATSFITDMARKFLMILPFEEN